MKNQKVLIIAEAGVNHNGSLEQAKLLVDAAKLAGADVVKFQTFKAENLVTRTAGKAKYQEKQTGTAESQFDMLKKLELNFDEFLFLADYCDKKQIEFLSTAFDEECLEFLVTRTGIRRIKIPSGELTNGRLVAASARTQLPLIISTGMATLKEIEETLDICVWAREGSTGDMRGLFVASDPKNLPITILHCTTEYPAPFNDLNLKALNTLRDTFKLSVGFSDHSEGVLAPLAAVAMGSCVIEKHFTLSKKLPGPDHVASLGPGELATMIAQIRLVETMLGKSYKEPSPRELENAKVARKSLTAACAIKSGEVFSETNLTIKRPGTGISAMKYWQLLGQVATKNYQPDDLIDEAMSS